MTLVDPSEHCLSFAGSTARRRQLIKPVLKVFARGDCGGQWLLRLPGMFPAWDTAFSSATGCTRRVFRAFVVEYGRMLELCLPWGSFLSSVWLVLVLYKIHTVGKTLSKLIRPLLTIINTPSPHQSTRSSHKEHRRSTGPKHRKWLRGAGERGGIRKSGGPACQPPSRAVCSNAHQSCSARPPGEGHMDSVSRDAEQVLGKDQQVEIECGFAITRTLCLSDRCSLIGVGAKRTEEYWAQTASHEMV